MFFQGYAYSSGLTFSFSIYSDASEIFPCGAKVNDSTGSNVFFYTDKDTSTLTSGTDHGITSYTEWVEENVDDVVELDKLNFFLASETYNASYSVFACYSGLSSYDASDAASSGTYNYTIEGDFGLQNDGDSVSYFTRSSAKIVVNATCINESGTTKYTLGVLDSLLTSGATTFSKDVATDGTSVLSKCLIEFQIQEIGIYDSSQSIDREANDATHMELFVDVVQSN